MSYMRDPRKVYLTNHVATLEGRALESTILRLMSDKIVSLCNTWDEPDLDGRLKEVLDRNMLLWQLFQSELSNDSNQNSPDVKSKLLSLSVFIMKTTFEVYLKPNKDKVLQLAEINLNISQGLSHKPT